MKEEEKRHYSFPACVKEEEDEVEDLNDVGGDGDNDLTERRWRRVKGACNYDGLS